METKGKLFLYKLIVILVVAICILNPYTVNAKEQKKDNNGKNANKSSTQQATDNNKKPEKTLKKDTTKNTVGIPTNVPASEALTYKKGVYHVSHDGTGDFTSIATAAVLVPSGSTLIIHEGIYNEALDIQSKLINMKGVSKEKCVIQYDTANYAHVPLNIAAGTYENLTINGYHKANKTGAFSGYAIHIDCDSLTGQSVVFNNCNIISENAFCVGIGLRKGAKIAFRGCNFTAKKQGTILFHDSQNPSLAGAASINIENCVLNNQTDQLIVTQCISPASVTNITFKNNTVIGKGDGACLAYGSYAGNGDGWMGSQNVILTASSSGNNIMSFNYSDMKNYRESLVAQSQQTAVAVNSNIGSNGKIKSRKFYTVTDYLGREVNVPAETIDGFITYEDGSIEMLNADGTPSGIIKPAPQVGAAPVTGQTDD